MCSRYRSTPVRCWLRALQSIGAKLEHELTIGSSDRPFIQLVVENFQFEGEGLTRERETRGKITVTRGGREPDPLAWIPEN